MVNNAHVDYGARLRTVVDAVSYALQFHQRYDEAQSARRTLGPDYSPLTDKLRDAQAALARLWDVVPGAGASVTGGALLEALQTIAQEDSGECSHCRRLVAVARNAVANVPGSVL